MTQSRCTVYLFKRTPSYLPTHPPTLHMQYGAVSGAVGMMAMTREIQMKVEAGQLSPEQVRCARCPCCELNMLCWRMDGARLCVWGGPAGLLKQ